MKKFIKIFLKILLIAIVLASLPLFYNFLLLGQKDFGLTKIYRYCEDGIYSTYDRGYTDGSDTYYDKNNEVIGQCHSWVEGNTCQPAKSLAGSCEAKGVYSFIYLPLTNLTRVFLE